MHRPTMVFVVQPPGLAQPWRGRSRATQRPGRLVAAPAVLRGNRGRGLRLRAFEGERRRNETTAGEEDGEEATEQPAEPEDQMQMERDFEEVSTSPTDHSTLEHDDAAGL
jgi:hypothetical protein